MKHKLLKLKDKKVNIVTYSNKTTIDCNGKLIVTNEQADMLSPNYVAEAFYNKGFRLTSSEVNFISNHC